MSCPVQSESIQQLKQFIQLCKATPQLLHIPELSFFKEFIESLGGSIPAASSKPTFTSKPNESNAKPQSNTDQDEGIEESDPESDLELDMTGCIEPDELSEDQIMGDDTGKEISEEDMDKADLKRTEAMRAFNEGNYEEAIKLYTEAIQLNPNSALFYAKRGQTYLKQNKPNACIKDCSKALELNCDSAASYKFRGRAYRLLGEWELAAKDLRQACKIDFDEQADEWLKEVQPNAKKIEQHRLKQERRLLDKQEKERLERIRRAKEAHAQAAEEGKKDAHDAPPSGGGGMPPMGDFYNILNDPEIRSALSDPDVSAAFADISANPANFIKYQSNPKVMELLKKLSSKVNMSGMNFPGFGAGGGGGFPFFPGSGTGGASSQRGQAPPDDDLLD